MTIHIRVDDPDYDVSAAGEDQIAENTTSSSNRGPLKIYVARGSDAVVLATAGGDGLGGSGFTLVETGKNTGVFTGDFQVPAEYCARSSGSGVVTSVMGTDIEVNYVDYRDASGEIIEVGDGAGIRGNTGSVSLDLSLIHI